MRIEDPNLNSEIYTDEILERVASLRTLRQLNTLSNCNSYDNIKGREYNLDEF